MLIPGTQMHFVTFGFVCIELVVLFYLLIYRLARPDDKRTYLNIILITLLILYNVTGGLLPDPNLPGSNLVQNSIAYGTGFITPCFFPYYVYHAFGLQKMNFHAYRGVFFFLVIPYILFVVAFALTNDLGVAKDILIIAVLYAMWVIYSLLKSIRFKYSNDFSSFESKIELVVLFFSIMPWLGVPFIAYYDLNQWIEAIITNGGFLLLLALHLNRTITLLRKEHERLIQSEYQLMNWNAQLQAEVEKRTQELERIGKEERFNDNCRRYSLSKREKELARYICQGLTYKDIGQQVHIAETTVAKHAQNIFEKVRVSNKMELCTKLEKLLPSK